MEPKVGERSFALSAPGAFNERLGRRRCQVPASAVFGENARLCSRAGHRFCHLEAVVTTVELRDGMAVFPHEKVCEWLFLAKFEVELRVVWSCSGRGVRPKNAVWAELSRHVCWEERDAALTIAARWWWRQ